MVQSTPPNTETLEPSPAKASAPDSWMVQQQHPPPSVKINDCNEIPPHRRTRPADSCHPINRNKHQHPGGFTHALLFFFQKWFLLSSLILYKSLSLSLRAALRACRHTQRHLSLSRSAVLDFPVVPRLLPGD